MEKTLKEAQQNLRDNWDEGVKCECCGQFVKLYKIKFNSNMAIFLLSLVKLYAERKEPIHYKECTFGSRNYPYVEKWGLAHTTKSKDTKKRMSGLWEPTKEGVAFVYKNLTVREYKHIYNNIIVDQSGRFINIKQALGNKFNYEELMKI